MRSVILLVLFIFSTNAVTAQQASDEPPKNVILFIADGYGPAMSTLARDYQRVVLGGGDALVMDALEVGSVRTFSTSSRVTDSAAGATAYAAGVKTYNGAIAVDTTQAPVGTLLEAAHDRGMLTGVVTTTRVTHATPASFTAHVPRRSLENEIAVQQIHSGADLIMGGGWRHFVPESVSDDSERTDDRNLLDEAMRLGYNVTTEWEVAQTAALPLIALFDDSSMPFEIDRDDDEPSLADMTRLALERLSASDDGYFVMIEAARIDHAAHDNDAAGTLHDVLAYDEALAVALEFVEADGNTLLVGVADHETGGMSIGRAGVYGWYPSVLSRIRTSHGPMVSALERGGDIADVMSEYAGITDLSDEERTSIATARDEGRVRGALIEIIGRRAAIGWTTGGHTGVDVKLYATGPGRDRFLGNHDNTYVGQVIAELLGLDLDAVTARLQASAEVPQD